MKKFFQVVMLVLVAGSYSFAQEKKKVDSLLFALKKQKADTNKVNILNEIAYEFINDTPDTAIYFANEALTLANKLNYRFGIATSYLWRGTQRSNLGHYEDALLDFNNAIKLYEELICSTEVRGRYRLLKHQAKAYINIGTVYKDQGAYPEALKSYFKGLKTAEEITDKIMTAVSFGSIGNIYLLQKDYSEALKNYLVALKFIEESGNKSGAANTYNNIGIVYKELGNEKEALENYSKALKLFKETGNKQGVSKCLGNIGNIYADQCNHVRALESHYASLKLCEEIGDVVGILTAYGNLADNYINLNNSNKAYQYLNKSLLLSKEIGFADGIRETNYALSKIDSMRGDFKKALEHYQVYILYRDSLYNEENTRKTVQTAMQYEFDKKQALQKSEQEKKDLITQARIKREKTLRNSFAAMGCIIILTSFVSFRFYKRKRDALQKQRDAEQQVKETAAALRISESELKALRLQMNPHFLNNTLQSIQHFLNEHQPDEAEAYLVKFSQLMRAVLLNSQQDEIPLSDELNTLEWYMQLENLRMKYPFTYTINKDKSIDLEHTFIPPNILQPFVENSIKHGLYPKNAPGNITIHIRKKEEDLHIIIEDDGIGRKAEPIIKEGKIFSRKSLGIKITEERLNLMNRRKNSHAAFSIADLFQNNKPSGTLVELHLPLEI